jgi:hypothetical protein
MKNKALSAMTETSAASTFLHGAPFSQKYTQRPREICIPEVIENKRVKKSLLKMKIPLDKILFSDTISLVEKCAPTQSGRFAFMAL